MARNTKQNANYKVSELSDRSVLYNGKNYYYYDTFTKKAYILQNKNALTYNRYSLRTLTALFIGLVCFYVLHSSTLALVLGIGFYVVIELIFRIKFLPTLTELDNPGNTTKDSMIEHLAKTMDKKSLIIGAVFGFVMFLILPLNGAVRNFAGFDYMLNNLVTFGFTAYAVSCVFAIFRQKKIQNNK